MVTRGAWSSSLTFIALVALTIQPVTLHGQANTTGIARAAWLQGCWESVNGDRAVDEHWMAPRGTSMLMMGRTVRGGRLADHELVVLSEDGDRLAYEAHPAGQPSAVFHSTVITFDRIVFENRAHDFPQQVGYLRNGADGLTAWIAGSEKGQSRRVEFVYRRTRCDP